MTDTGEPTEGGHAAHMRAINAVRRAGSIANAVAMEYFATASCTHAWWRTFLLAVRLDSR